MEFISSQWNLNQNKSLEDEMTVKTKLIDINDLDPRTPLPEAYKKLFVNEETYDTILHVGNKEYKVHKAVLIARSPAFAALFLQDCKYLNKEYIEKKAKRMTLDLYYPPLDLCHSPLEKQIVMLTIPNCDPDSFHKFLEYIYTGKIEKASLSNLFHLYQISNKYIVPNLKTFCSQYLTENLTRKIIFDILVMANEHHDLPLLYAVQMFIAIQTNLSEKYFKKSLKTKL